MTFSSHLELVFKTFFAYKVTYLFSVTKNPKYKLLIDYFHLMPLMWVNQDMKKYISLQIMQVKFELNPGVQQELLCFILTTGIIFQPFFLPDHLFNQLYGLQHQFKSH